MCRFSSLGQILAYYQHCKPGRQISINLLEPDSISVPESFELSIYTGSKYLGSFSDKNVLWAFVCRKISKHLDSFGGKDSPDVRAFIEYYLNPDQKLELESIARTLGRSTRTVRRWLRRIYNSLEDDFMSSGLLSPRDETL